MNLGLPNGVDFRPMTSADVPMVLEIIKAHDEDDYNTAKASFARGIADHYILTYEEEIVGTTGASYADGTDSAWWLSWTYLNENYRGGGLGSLMLKTLISKLEEVDARKVFVNVSDYVDINRGAIYSAALKAYKRVGFEEELRHKDYYDRNESLIVLGLRLKQQHGNGPVAESDQRACVIVDCDEISDTDDAYLIDWEFTQRAGATNDDIRKLLGRIARWEGRVAFVGVAADATRVIELFTNNGFIEDGRLSDFYEDGLDDVHLRYDLF